MSKRKKDWRYCDANHQKCGVMVCNKCNQDITTGQFKVYEDNDGAFRGHHHRACSEDDAKWASLDREAAARLAKCEQYLAAMIKFKEEWGTDALDEEIEWHEAALARSKL